MIRLFKTQQQIIVHAQPFKWLLIFGEGSPAIVFLRTESGFADLRPGGNGGVSGEPEFMNSKRIRIAKNGAHIMHTAYIMEPKDRKSTRLNSSHVAISYAVFCLKKKKQHKQYTF